MYIPCVTCYMFCTHIIRVVICTFFRYIIQIVSSYIVLSILFCEKEKFHLLNVDNKWRKLANIVKHIL